MNEVSAEAVSAAQHKLIKHVQACCVCMEEASCVDARLLHQHWFHLHTARQGPAPAWYQALFARARRS